MSRASAFLTIAGSFSGGLALVLLMGGWLGLVSYALITAGALFIAAAATGLLSRAPK